MPPLNRVSRRSSPAARAACSIGAFRPDPGRRGFRKRETVMGRTRMLPGLAPLSAGVFDLRLTAPLSLFTGRPTCPIPPRS